MSNGLDTIVIHLQEIAGQQNLVQRAEEGYRRYLANCSIEEGLPQSWVPESIQAVYRSSALCFHSSLLSYPYVTTTLDLFVDKNEVGNYRLITALNGEFIDDYLVFEPWTLSGATE